MAKFFKVLLPGSFETKLSLPPKFVARLADAEAPPGSGTATLRDPAGRSWRVKIDRYGCRMFFAGKAWRECVARNGLAAGHFLFFVHEGGLRFSFDPFDTTGCLKEYGADDATQGTTAETIEIIDLDAYTTDESDSGSEPDSPPADRRHVRRRYRLLYMDLSRDFCSRIGWTWGRDVELCVAGAKRLWRVGFVVYDNYSSFCSGWRQFVRDNMIKLGDTCVFKLVGRNKLEVEVVRS